MFIAGLILSDFCGKTRGRAAKRPGPLHEPLFRDKWQESHEAGALHCLGELALALGIHEGLLLAHEACMRIQELLQELHILVIDVFDIILRKKALFHRKWIVL